MLSGVEITAVVGAITTGIATIITALALQNIKCFGTYCNCNNTDKHKEKPKEVVNKEPTTITTTI